MFSTSRFFNKSIRELDDIPETIIVFICGFKPLYIASTTENLSQKLLNKEPYLVQQTVDQAVYNALVVIKGVVNKYNIIMVFGQNFLHVHIVQTPSKNAGSAL